MAKNSSARGSGERESVYKSGAFAVVWGNLVMRKWQDFRPRQRVSLPLGHCTVEFNTALHWSFSVGSVSPCSALKWFLLGANVSRKRSGIKKPVTQLPCRRGSQDNSSTGTWHPRHVLWEADGIDTLGILSLFLKQNTPRPMLPLPWGQGTSPQNG